MRIKTDDILSDLSDTDMTTATITGPAIWLGHICNFSIQLVFTGSPNGAFKLQASNDEPDKINPSNTVPTNWTDIADSTQSISASGNVMWNYQNAGFTFVRLVWTDVASGASAITVAKFMLKGV